MQNDKRKVQLRRAEGEPRPREDARLPWKKPKVSIWIILYQKELSLYWEYVKHKRAKRKEKIETTKS